MDLTRHFPMLSTTVFETSNYPDVMMPSYNASYYAVFFFWGFIVIGIFFLMPLILAVIYNDFQKSNQEFFTKLFVRRGQALDEAFYCLATAPHRHEKKMLPVGSRVMKLETIQKRIYLGTWKALIKELRPNLPAFQAEVLYLAVSGATDMDDTGIDRKSFRNLLDFLFVNITLDPIREQEAMLSENIRTLDDIKRTLTLFRLRLLTIVINPWYLAFSDFMVISGAAVIMVQLLFEVNLDSMSYVYLWFFFIELCYRYVAMGNRLFYSIFERFDAFVIVTTLALFLVFQYFTAMSEEGTAAFIILRSIRLLKISRTSKTFRLIFRTAKTVTNSFLICFALLLSVYYVFAIIGVQIFEGVVTQQTTKDKLQDAQAKYHTDRNNVDYQGDVAFWDFINSNFYYQNNFNSFSQGIVVLLELTVVNNWHVISTMYVELTTDYAWIFFFSFYVIAVLIVANVIIAFILDAFMLQIEIEDKNLRQEQREMYLSRVTDGLELYLQENYVEEMWEISRNSLKTLLFEAIFGDDTLAAKLKLTPLETIVAWEPYDVKEWMRDLGLAYHKYLRIVDEYGIDGRMLFKLTKKHLKSMGMSSPLERERFLLAIQDLIQSRQKVPDVAFAILESAKADRKDESDGYVHAIDAQALANIGVGVHSLGLIKADTIETESSTRSSGRERLQTVISGRERVQTSHFLDGVKMDDQWMVTM